MIRTVSDAAHGERRLKGCTSQASTYVVLTAANLRMSAIEDSVCRLASRIGRCNGPHPALPTGSVVMARCSRRQPPTSVCEMPGPAAGAKRDAFVIILYRL